MVENIVERDEKNILRIYDLDGHLMGKRIDELKKGVYVIEYEDGSALKVVI